MRLFTKLPLVARAFCVLFSFIMFVVVLDTGAEMHRQYSLRGKCFPVEDGKNVYPHPILNWVSDFVNK